MVGKWTSSIWMAASLSSTARGEAGGQRPEPGAQRDVQTIGEEGHEDVRLNALLQMVVDRPICRSSLRFLKAASTSTS